jgi:DNA polymerase III sliding clamp (beta) subunit (PCNA family)
MVQGACEVSKKADPGIAITLTASDLALSINRIKHAMATDQARPILAAMHFEITRDRLRLAAADNYRIAWADLELDPDEGRDRSFTLTRDDVLFLLRWLKAYPGRNRAYPPPVTLTVGVERIEVTIGRSDTVMRKVTPVLSFWLVDETYPDYKQLIPDKADKPTIALNGLYLEEVGKAMRAEGMVKVYITDPLKPALFEVYGVAGGELVMPVKTADFADRHVETPPPAYPADVLAAVES